MNAEEVCLNVKRWGVICIQYNEGFCKFGGRSKQVGRMKVCPYGREKT